MSKNNLNLSKKLKWQRASDLATLALWSPLLVPLTACVLAISYRDCGIPPVYIQKRIGYMGKTFNVIKARTMQDLDKLDSTGVLKVIYNQLDAEGKADFDNEFRISKIGKFIRQSRLDELTQIWNIAKGEMSIVGPRPHKVEDDINEKFKSRQDVRPGLTGDGQLELNGVSHDIRGQKDVEYVDMVRENSMAYMQIYESQYVLQHQWHY